MACAGPGFFFKGGGGSRPDGQKTVWTTFFLVLNLFYSLQRGSNDIITEKTILFQGTRGGPTLFRGSGWGEGPTFSRGSKC